jgi:hypothetical protein
MPTASSALPDHRHSHKERTSAHRQSSGSCLSRSTVSMAEPHAGQDDKLLEPDGDLPMGSSSGDGCVWPSVVEAVGRTSEGVPLCVWILVPALSPGV